MLWLIWKQHRREALVGALLVVVIALALISVGLANSVNSLCIKTDTCQSVGLSLGNVPLSMLNVFPWLLPLLVGVFVGAPLIAREREQHTYPLIWTQSITRTRWLTVKLSVIAGVLLLVFTLLAVLSIWDYSMMPLSRSWDLFTFSMGVPLIGFGLFGLMLGVAMGAFVRKIAPAMVLTVIVFLAIAITLGNFSPYFIPPLSHLYPRSITSQNGAWGQPGDLELYAGYADSAGHEVGELSTYCGFHATIRDATYAALANQCLVTHNLQWKIVYQPADRIWLLQWIELAVLLILSTALVPLTYWRLRQRRE